MAGTKASWFDLSEIPQEDLISALSRSELEWWIGEISNKIRLWESSNKKNVLVFSRLRELQSLMRFEILKFSPEFPNSSQQLLNFEPVELNSGPIELAESVPYD